MPFTLDDLQQVAPRVLARLRAMAEFPEDGTVAGQSVASLFWEELGLPLKGPVNDIDVFVRCSMPRALRGLPELPEATGSRAPRRQGTVIHTKGAKTDTNYNHIRFIALRTSTQILRTYQVGLVNYTLIQHPSFQAAEMGYDARVSQEIIEGFDLNLVQIGIHARSGQVVASQGFLDFLSHHHMQVNTCNTPAHTLVRLARKYYDGQLEGVACDYDAERTMLEMALVCQKKGAERTLMRNMLRLGSKYQAHTARLHAHLPALQKSTVTLDDGSNYLFEHLVPRALTDPVDLALEEAVDHFQLELDYAVFDPVYITHFPAIYGLLHPGWRANEPADIEQRRAAWQAMDLQESNDSLGKLSNIHLLRQALGQPALPQTMTDLDEHQTVAFFLGHACAQRAEDIARTLSLWESLAPWERRVLRGLDVQGDGLAVFEQARGPAWADVLAKCSGEVFFTQMLHASRDMESWREDVQQGLLALLATMESQPGAWDRLIKSEKVHEQGTFPPRSQLLGVLLRTFDAPLRAQVAERVARALMPEWPNLTPHTPVDVVSILVHEHVYNNVPVPETVWQPLVGQHRRRLIQAAGRAAQEVQTIGFDHQKQGFHLVEQMSEGLSLDSWTANHGRLLRMWLTLDPQACLRLLAHGHDDSDVMATLAALLVARQGHHKWGNFARHIKPSYANDGWWPELVAIEQLVLQMSLPMADPPASRSRMRL